MWIKTFMARLLIKQSMRSHALGFKGEELSASMHRHARPWCKPQCVSQGHLWLREIFAQVSSDLWPSQQHRECGWPSPPRKSCHQCLSFLEEAPPPLITPVSHDHPFLFLQNPAAVVFQLANTGGWFPSGHWEEVALLAPCSWSVSLRVWNWLFTTIPLGPRLLPAEWDSQVSFMIMLFSLLTAQVLGPCNRCQMICIDQQTGQRNQDVFQKLSERRERKVSMIAKYDTPS